MFIKYYALRETETGNEQEAEMEAKSQKLQARSCMKKRPQRERKRPGDSGNLLLSAPAFTHSQSKSCRGEQMSQPVAKPKDQNGAMNYHTNPIVPVELISRLSLAGFQLGLAAIW